MRSQASVGDHIRAGRSNVFQAPPPQKLAGDVRSFCTKEKKMPSVHGGEEQRLTNLCKLAGILRDVRKDRQSHASRTSLHYGCKDEFKNTQECELFSPSPHTLRDDGCSYREPCGE